MDIMPKFFFFKKNSNYAMHHSQPRELSWKEDFKLTQFVLSVM